MATRIIPTDMNDQNKEEPSRYVRIIFVFSLPYCIICINRMHIFGSPHFVSMGLYKLKEKDGLFAALGNFPIYVSGFCLHFICLFFT